MLNKNLIVNGEFKSGKTSGIIMPIVDGLIKSDKSLLFIDKKFEYYGNYASKLKKEGYEIKVLNFDAPMYSDSVNVLSVPYKYYKDGDKDKAYEIVSMIVSAIFPKDVNNDPFWTDSAISLVRGYILKLLPRHNSLMRPPISNVDQALLVFSAKEPDMNLLLLDRFLILIEHLHIHPVICISKMDLADEKHIHELLKPYEDAGYQVIYVSSKQEQGIEIVKKIFKDRITVVTGQSGVGKSSLLNALDIHLQIDTNEISKALGRGKHTTRHVELISMYGGYVADTPGFSSLELQIDPVDLAHSYHDFEQLSKQCKFRGCLHESEPHCAIKEAVEAGTISSLRYEHYLTFLIYILLHPFFMFLFFVVFH